MNKNILLESIKRKLLSLLARKEDGIELDFNEVYLAFKKDPFFKQHFKHRNDLHSFLLHEHKRGALASGSLNYSAPSRGMEWKFFIEDQFAENTQPCSRVTFSEEDHLILATDGSVLHSKLECCIYEKLLSKEQLQVWFDYPVDEHGNHGRANFYIKHIESGNFYFWEHMHSDLGEDNITERKQWFKDQGFYPIEEHGQIIFTNEKQFETFDQKIEEYIDLLA